MGHAGVQVYKEAVRRKTIRGSAAPEVTLVRRKTIRESAAPEVTAVNIQPSSQAASFLHFAK